MKFVYAKYVIDLYPYCECREEYFDDPTCSYEYDNIDDVNNEVVRLKAEYGETVAIVVRKTVEVLI